ncbi:MAG TPA: histidine phosphatase family protein [Bryobacteraceae bacterium]|nr:histidine phosphatase family protein [Bryobacteraceae bacterium]
MEIYLLRHGIAEEPAPGQSDADRALTAEGRKKLRAVLESAADAGVCPALIITSPLRRAVQTAEIATETLEYKGDVLRSRVLRPEAEPAEAWEEIRLHRDVPSLLLAGHEPLFGSLFAFLLGDPSLQVDFKKGALARIDVGSFGARPRGVLKWMLTPRLVRER